MKGLQACDNGWKLIHEGVDGTPQVLVVDEVISSAPCVKSRFTLRHAG